MRCKSLPPWMAQQYFFFEQWFLSFSNASFASHHPFYGLLEKHFFDRQFASNGHNRYCFMCSLWIWKWMSIIGVMNGLWGLQIGMEIGNWWIHMLLPICWRQLTGQESRECIFWNLERSLDEKKWLVQKIIFWAIP